jgi:hypothetical protein
MNFLIFPIQLLVYQFLFRIIIFLFKAAIRVIIYSPQLLTAYLLCKTVLKKEEPVQVWVIGILLVAFLFYQFIFLLKMIMQGLRRRENWLWLPLFLILVTYTCIFPLWISFDTVQHVMSLISGERGTILTWLSLFCFGFYLYSRYSFLNS